MESAVKEAIKRAGGATVVARAFDISPQAVHKWVRKRLPAEQVIALARLSGVAPELLRPDLYPSALHTSRSAG